MCALSQMCLLEDEEWRPPCALALLEEPVDEVNPQTLVRPSSTTQAHHSWCAPPQTMRTHTSSAPLQTLVCPPLKCPLYQSLVRPSLKCASSLPLFKPLSHLFLSFTPLLLTQISQVIK